jgi:hypothetical protein
MVAICPACHDAAHHGSLKIEDATIYRWKGIDRPDTVTDHLYVEPGQPTTILLGSVLIEADRGVNIFEMSPGNTLSFHVKDGDILHLNLRISALDGKTVLRVVDGHVKFFSGGSVTFDRRPGHIRVTAPSSPDFTPLWAISKMRSYEADYASDGRVTLVDLEVLEPGQVQILGVWIESNRAVVATPKAVYYLPSAPTLKGNFMADFAIVVPGHINRVSDLFVFGQPPDQ